MLLIVTLVSGSNFYYK